MAVFIIYSTTDDKSIRFSLINSDLVFIYTNKLVLRNHNQFRRNHNHWNSNNFTVLGALPNVVHPAYQLLINKEYSLPYE